MARIALALTIVFAPSLAQASNCGKFFVAHKQVAVVAPVVYPAVIYQAGRDVEAEAIAERVFQRLSQKLQQQSPVQQQQLTAPKTSVMSQHCAKCHSGANPKAGRVYDGVSPISGDDGMDGLREMADGRMPKDHKLPPELFGPLMQEILDLHKAGKTASDLR